MDEYSCTGESWSLYRHRRVFFDLWLLRFHIHVVLEASSAGDNVHKYGMALQIRVRVEFSVGPKWLFECLGFCPLLWFLI